MCDSVSSSILRITYRTTYDDDDVQWVNVYLKADWKPACLAHNAKVETNMPEKNEKQLESVELVRWVER